jgi:hypothetical protein
MIEAVERELGGVDLYAHHAWREWVNTMHGEVPSVQLPKEILEAFRKVWYPQEGDPASISELNKFSKWLVQQAFLGGYREGFTTRILRGDANE